MSDELDNNSYRMEDLRERQVQSWQDCKPLFVEALIAGVAPELSQNELMELIYAEITLRSEHGESCKPEEYLRRFPENAERLERLFEIHEFFVSDETEHSQTFETSMKPLAQSSTRFEASDLGNDSLQTQNDNTANLEVRESKVTAGSPIPERVGRYRIDRILGEGGFGIVYLGYDDQLTRPVAVKVPRAGVISCSEDLDAYLTEARTVANLDHPNIVAVHDVGSTVEFPCYIVSKFIEGSDLARRLKESRLPIEKTVELVATIAEALDFAHRQGLVHRDVKPGNILLDKSDHAFLVDFGMALKEQDAANGTSFAGTPAYMSPEQARGEGHRVDCRSDIFSLGAVFYEMLTGTRPFREKTLEDLLQQITQVEVRPPRQIDEAIPKEVERICLKALAKRAAERYSVSKEMADDLHYFLNQFVASTNADGSLSPLAQARQTLATLNDSKSSVSVSLSGQVLKIVPKGLRSFDAHDANFFLELLPGPRDRDGLPDSLRFWRTRLEESDSDETFSVGLIYGPSGCGKSSLVKAGLLPRLSAQVIPIYVEATTDDTETRLLNGLRKRCPDLSDKMSLKETLVALRFGKGRPSKTKIVIVLDQFEQWLHTWTDDQNCELVQALRQCDGGRVQCLVMVRDDFWMAATRFMRALEIPLIEGKNSAAVDLFYADHAKKVLAAFGRAFGKLPESAREISKEQKGFLDRAIKELARDGKVISVRLALFAEMMKGKPWTNASLIDVGGAEGVGRAFLEETFSSTTAPPEHRHHQMAARGALKALLPELDTEIKGHMRSSAELKEAAEYGSRDKDFGDLIRILDNEIRLITPTDPEGIEKPDGAASPTIPGQKYYQLTHDYLVPSLRDWLTHEQKQTRQGRTELMLADRANVWNSRKENRQLPSYLQWLSIHCLIPKRKWTEPQRKMMAKANAYYARMQASSVLLLAIAFVVGLRIRNQAIQRDAVTLVNQIQDADAAAVPGIIEKIADARESVSLRLREKYEGIPDGAKNKLNVTLALVSLDLGQPELVADLFNQSLKAEPDKLLMIRNVLEKYHFNFLANTAVSNMLWETVTKTASGDKRLRAAALLAYFDSESSHWGEKLEASDKSVPKAIVDELIAVNPRDLKTWIELFRLVKQTLIYPLEKFYEEGPKGNKRHFETYFLDDYVQNAPKQQAELLMKADAEQFKIIYPTFINSTRQNEGIVELEKKIKYVITLVESNSGKEGDKNRESSAKEAANAAVVLLRMKRDDELVWSLLRHRHDPRIRSNLIHRFEPFGVDPAVLWVRFGRKPEISIRRALLMSLGEFDKGAVSLSLAEFDNRLNLEEHYDAILNELRMLYKADGDPGLHAAVEWLFRKWGEDAWLAAEEKSYARKERDNLKLQRIIHEHGKFDWYVNGQKQTMVVIPGPVTFWMGSRMGEFQYNKDEPYHLRKINKTFAIASKLVTVKQFEDSKIEFSWDELPKECTDVEQPIIGVTWFQAAKYCNWLSRMEGISEDQLCYEETDDDKEQPVKCKPNYANLSGYRLPTEVEWEYAARADSRTARFFGQTEEYMQKYSWNLENSNNRPGKVGLLKPNDFGLFDMLGNQCVWCQELYSESGPKGNANEILLEADDPELSESKIENAVVSKTGALRGGAHDSPAAGVRVSKRIRLTLDAAETRVGFRVARYLP